jgi:hypothetical protein
VRRLRGMVTFRSDRVPEKAVTVKSSMKSMKTIRLLVDTLSRHS